MTHTPPSSPLLDHLTAALDRKLRSLASDADRLQFLASAFGNWSMLYSKFMGTGEQPFGGPHPTFGAMDMWDFRLLLIAIEKRQRELPMVAA